MYICGFLYQSLFYRLFITIDNETLGDGKGNWITDVCIKINNLVIQFINKKKKKKIIIS